MICELILAIALIIQTVTIGLLSREVSKLTAWKKAADPALRSVKQAIEDYPRIKNEVLDMRSILDNLPVDDLMAQAEFEKAYADGLASINNYSVEVAMKGGGERI